LIDYITNLRIRSEVYTSRERRSFLHHEAIPQAKAKGNLISEHKRKSVMPRDIQDDSRLLNTSGDIHRDKIFQVINMVHDISDLDDIHSEPEQLTPVIVSADQFIQKSHNERKAFNKQKQIGSYSRTRSGKIPVKPLTKTQRNQLQAIPKSTWAEHLDTLK